MSLIPWRKPESSLTHPDPFEDLWRSFDPFRNFQNRLPATFAARNLPAMNVSESESHYSVTLELPGLDAKDVTIDLLGNQLTISGERKWEEAKKEKEFHHVESQYGSFSRTLTLPSTLRLDRESIEATFQKGVLEIKIPKLEPTPAAKIPIRAK
jgi:HSP20 family protein